MEPLPQAPHVPQDPKYTTQVISALRDLSKKGKAKGGFSVKSKDFVVPDGSGRIVESWQMQDWDYKKSGLPTYARGLFTHHNAKHEHEIIARGYDKFFNVGEVNNTQWRNIETNTRGPYELSVKENGCIIFVAGLDDSTLLVTSKHSTGPRKDLSANHALAGEKWIDRQLAALGKTRADLARQLKTMNATAVAELCDDDFEEHVLEYAPEQAGLYLHGINLNLPEFATYPSGLVEKFAEDWGFRKTMFVVEHDIQKVKAMLEKVAETGSYDGRDTEGFVIRCQARDNPHAEWHDWFFKYKFEEPYLMYRLWREVTKTVISGKQPTFRKHKKITEEYIFFARRQLAKDPSLGKAFNLNHGIIAMRNAFLQEKGLKGSEIIQLEEQDGQEDAVTRDVVLVPIATIGCGKTTVANALVKLFGWGHQQNDNIVGKGRRPQRFAEAVLNSLAADPVVIADRNNHQFRERQQIIDDVHRVVPHARMVALHWVHDRGNFDEICQVMQHRVLSRGDNHQTIQADSKGREEILGIMDGFLKRFEPCDTSKKPDEMFDLVIDLDVTADSRTNVQVILESLSKEYPKLFTMPTEGEMDAAIAWALDEYKPDIKHDLSGGTGKESKKQQKAATGKQSGSQKARPKPLKPEYFGITLPESRVKAILGAVFSEESIEKRQFYTQLQETRRVQLAFHVTLMHRSGQAQHGAYWAHLNDLFFKLFNAEEEAKGFAPIPSNIELAKARVQLERIVWDGRVMAILVRLLDADDGFPCINEFAHITVGTAADGIKPFESNALLSAWNAGGNERIQDVKIKGNVVLEGSVKAAMMK
ncbi:hypothetical protein FH972_022058 [Carpinus fangiana]|uniref:tRNA ligase n=1 Tax=Carpinus fangiana TaxID=176857 RepID=A0A5N6KR48_9ROSI|nr:hypothetical protein FH972_022058 [Carpinus fangiana]